MRFLAHWNREEMIEKEFIFEFPYKEGLKKVRKLLKTDYDPTVLWVWSTMQARAVIEILKSCEREFGEEGQRVVYEALKRVGREVVEQMISKTKFEGLNEMEAVSFFATLVNTIAYASVEKPWVEGDEVMGFDIIWCPHQDVYSAFDCRVQRYFVQGMLEALREKYEKETGRELTFQVKFEKTIPAGDDVCRFVIWKAEKEDIDEWERYTELLNRRALELARK
ncbi:L-2-amino-thiazoline-4-carboxylic acid hydrolase [Archaeoglobus sp. UBA230]|uniref:L-2-amino-thiazoline-4-carboxylic acid hydrolase n=1 Tax=Archaeoglobus sp. UBA230 TaxID=1915565 RepID=UPI0025C14B1D|nr:L-2-amino-thiazoline-4-carboxylic acid hydrolase [Archaeoglobus sp. UBA230]